MSTPLALDLTPPDDAAVERAVAAFADAVRRAYGDRVKGIYLFGSRARGDHTPESDADVAVVLADDGWRSWPESKRLSDIAYDLVVDSGADIQVWPVGERDWRRPPPGLVATMRRDARPIGHVDG